ncbi:MAG: Ig-like domain-containing protein, partial [Planctomycetes bacterium]|nr:Ig-like domain-containing protein [Planctomycetota bacterium]
MRMMRASKAVTFLFVVATALLGVPSASAQPGDPTPLERKTDAIAALEQAQQDFPSFASRLAKVIRRIERSLFVPRGGCDGECGEDGDDENEQGPCVEPLFLTPTFLDSKWGRRVFREEEKAVREAEEILKKRNVPSALRTLLEGVIASMVAADRDLAQIAIDEATAFLGSQAAANQDLQRAIRDLARGDAKMAANKPRDAIKHYGKAWEHATEAGVPDEAVRLARDTRRLIRQTCERLEHLPPHPGHGRNQALIELAERVERSVAEILAEFEEGIGETAEDLGLTEEEVRARDEEILARFCEGRDLEALLDELIAALAEAAQGASPAAQAAVQEAIDALERLQAQVCPGEAADVVATLGISRLPCEVRAGVAFTVEVTAFKDDFTIATRAQGSVRVFSPTETDPRASFFGAGVVASFQDGRAAIQGTLVTAGPQTLRAELVGDGSILAERAVEVLPGVPATIALVSANPRQQAGKFLADLTASVEDGFGNGAFGAAVAFNASAGEVLDEADRGDGTYTAILSTTDAGPVTVTAQVDMLMSATQVSFTGPLDATSPVVVSFDPADGATLVPETAQVVVTFSEAIDPASAVNRETFFLTRSGSTTLIEGDLMVTGAILTFTPDAPLAFQAMHHILLTAGITDLAGNPLAVDAGATSSFTVKPAIFPPDTEKPFFISSDPANGATAVATGTQLFITYNEPLASGSLRSIQLPSGFITPSARGTTEFSVDRKTLIYTFDSPWPVGASIRVLTGTVVDLSNNFNTFITSITFNTVAADTVGPVVTESVPDDAETGVPLHRTIRLRFDEPLAPATLDPGEIRLEQGGSPVPVTITFDTFNRAVRIDPASLLDPQTDYTIVADGDFHDTFGNRFDQVPGAPPDPFTATFRTGDADVTGPRVAAVDPIDQDRGVSVLASVTLDFDEELDPATVTGTTVRLLDGATPVVGTLALQSGNRRVVFDPADDLALDRQYVVRVGGVADLSGNPLDQVPGGAVDPFVSTFRTTHIDRVGPRVVASSPVHQSTGVPVETRIDLTFNEPITVSRFPRVFQSTEVFGTWTLSQDGKALSFLPDANFLTNRFTSTSISFGSFAQDIRDLAGNPFSGSFSLFFTTIPTDVVAPFVAVASPAAGEGDVPICNEVILDFSEPVVPGSVGPGAFVLEGVGGAQVPGTVELQALNRRLVFTPDTFLQNLTDYRITFGSGVTDTANNPFTQFTSTFTTGPVDLVGPFVSQVDPAADAVGVPETSVVRLTFNERLDSASVTASTVQVRQGGSPVSGTLALAGRDTVVLFTPDADLALGGTFTISVDGVRDCVGNLFDQDPFGDTGPPGPEPFGSSFGITNVDRVSPRIVSSTPVNNARVLPADVINPPAPFEIVAIASEPVLPQSVNPRTVFLHAFRFLDFEGISFFGPNRVTFIANIPGDLSIDPDGRTIRFRPDPLELADLAELLTDTGMAFTFEVTSGVTDLAGNPLNQDGPGVLEGYRARFFIQNPFRVVSVEPEDGAEDVEPFSSVTLTFNDVPTGATVNASTFSVRTDEGPVSGSYFVFGFGRTATFSPSFPGLPAGSMVEVEATAGGIRSTGGEALSETFTSTFTTGFSSFNQVVSVDPPQFATNVPVNQAVTVVFASKLDPDVVAEGGVLKVGGFPGTVTLVDPKTLRFTPSVSYFQGTTVGVTVARVASFTSSFSTVPRTDIFISPEFVASPTVNTTFFYNRINFPPPPSGNSYVVTSISGVVSFTQSSYVLAANAPVGVRTVTVVVRDNMGHDTLFGTFDFNVVDGTISPDPVILGVGEEGTVTVTVDPALAATRVAVFSSPDIFGNRPDLLTGSPTTFPVRGESPGSGTVRAFFRYQGSTFVDVAQVPLKVVQISPAEAGRSNFEPKDVVVTFFPVDAVSQLLSVSPPSGIAIVDQQVAGNTLTATLRLDPSVPLGGKLLTVSFSGGATHGFPWSVFGAEVGPASGGPGGTAPTQVVRFSDLSPTARFTSPGDGAIALVSQNPPTVRLEGFVTDPVADVTSNDVADIRSVRVGGRRYALTPDPTQTPTPERPFAFRGLFSVDVPLQVGTNVVSAEATSILQKVGIDQVTIVVSDADGNPATPGLTARAINHRGSETQAQHPVFLSYTNDAIEGDTAGITIGFHMFTLTRTGGTGPFSGGPFLVGNVHHQVVIPGFFGGGDTPILVPAGVPVVLAELGSLKVVPDGDIFFGSLDDARVRIPGLEIRPVDRSGVSLRSGHLLEPNLGDNLTTNSFVRLVAAPVSPSGTTIDVDLASLDVMGSPASGGGEAPFSQSLTLPKEGDVYITPQAEPVALVRHATARANGRPQHRVVGGGILRATATGEQDEARTWDTLLRNVRVSGNEPFLQFSEVPQESIRGTTPADGGMGSVWLHNGEFHHAMTDVSIPGVGFPFEVTRTYRSQISYEGPFGVNWDFSLDMRLLDVSSFFFSAGGGGSLSQSLLLFDGSGRVDTFTFDRASGFYVPPAGWYVSLQRTGNAIYLLTDRHGTKYTFQQPDLPFRSYAYLATIEDRNGNMLAVHRDAQARIERVTDTLGRDILFFYEHPTESHLVTKVRDFAGREWPYVYNASNVLINAGRPSTAEFPAGTSWQYTYSEGQDPLSRDFLNHNLISIKDPKSQTFMVNQYDGEDRVSAQQYGTSSQRFIFNYGPTATRVTDRRGNQTEWEFPVAAFSFPPRLQPVPTKRIEFTRGLRPGDPARYVTAFVHNSEQERTDITHPEENRTQLVFDSLNPDRRKRGNLLEMRQVAGPRGDGAGGAADDLVTSWSYDPLFNFVRTTTDPRGNVPGATEALRA